MILKYSITILKTLLQLKDVSIISKIYMKYQLNNNSLIHFFKRHEVLYMEIIIHINCDNIFVKDAALSVLSVCVFNFWGVVIRNVMLSFL